MLLVWRRTLVALAVGIGVAFRLVGAVYNTEANDDHMTVIRVMAAERRLPGPAEFWEAFQPPLYHGASAVGLILVKPGTPEGEVRIAQAISCAAGLATLALLLAFIRGLKLSGATSTLASALVSLNPALISVSIQATNDAFVILFVTAALYWGYLFFKTG